MEPFLQSIEDPRTPAEAGEGVVLHHLNQIKDVLSMLPATQEHLNAQDLEIVEEKTEEPKMNF